MKEPTFACRIILAAALSLSAAAGGRAQQQPVVNVGEIRLVNIVPLERSNETQKDSEPHLTVNTANPNQIAASALTSGRGFCGPNTAPIYLSGDGGLTWSTNCIIPSDQYATTNDITLSFSGSGNTLYAAILRNPGLLRLNVLRTRNLFSNAPMTVLHDRDFESVDQPYIQAANVAGHERVYVGSNHLEAPDGKTATVEAALDAGGSAPAFQVIRVEARQTSGIDGPPTRIAVHPSGTIYAAFYGWRNDQIGFAGARTITADVVVVRDDNGAGGPAPFTALKDSNGVPGGIVAAGRTLPFKMTSFTEFGNERLTSSNITIAVDPRPGRQHTVYVAWADREGSDDYTLHVRRSTDGGEHWSGDLKKVRNATNPSLAVDGRGEVGFLYQKLVPGGGTDRWETHLELTSEASAFAESVDVFLANTPTTPAPETSPFIGDYIHLLAIGNNFYGIFSAYNTPDPDNFPAKRPDYQRNHNFTEKLLFGTDRKTPVSSSVDPFFFRVTVQ